MIMENKSLLFLQNYITKIYLKFDLITPVQLSNFVSQKTDYEHFSTITTRQPKFILHVILKKYIVNFTVSSFKIYKTIFHIKREEVIFK